ncbi:hypothetical protein [Aquella oligotrophica]|uniref:hypothetical protein n=1 Tax=Aquella oligotrophica TaxID=2067065 RepID=UPI001315336C|nr:hypothetical protein [Aquella oligotrophica]
MARECLFNIIVDEHADLFKSEVKKEVMAKTEEEKSSGVMAAVKDYTYAIAKGMLSFIS